MQLVLVGLLASGALVTIFLFHSASARSRPALPKNVVARSPALLSDPVTARPSMPPPAVAPPPVASRPLPKPAATPPPVRPWQPAHPQTDFMGSTIAAHVQAFLGPGVPTVLQEGTRGIDVSNWQGRINWAGVAASGTRFAYIKATEATTYTDPDFGPNYRGAANAGIIRGAYHFAVPNASSGTAQADYFVDHGGTWTGDGRTLPPALDIEYNPYGPSPCYGLTPGQMTSWVADFVTTVYQRTARWPVIYTTTNWWAMCTGNSANAGVHSPLWLASWTSSGQVRNRPSGWSSYTIWQYADRGVAPGDQDFFHGSYAQLEAFATRSDRAEGPSRPPVPVAASVPVSVPPAPGSPPAHSPVSPPLPATPRGVTGAGATSLDRTSSVG